MSKHWNEEGGKMSDELKPIRCGCGGEASMCYGFEHRNIYAVECDKCGICTCEYDTEAEAVQAWNRAMGTNTRRKKGKWQRRKGSDCWECSQCHAVLENDDLGMHNFYFCYHCGANMMNEMGYIDLEKANYE